MHRFSSELYVFHLLLTLSPTFKILPELTDSSRHCNSFSNNLQFCVVVVVQRCRRCCFDVRFQKWKDHTYTTLECFDETERFGSAFPMLVSRRQSGMELDPFHQGDVVGASLFPFTALGNHNGIVACFSFFSR